MAGLTAEADTLPDNDSFLPRYLTVQLLTILANTVQKSASLENLNISPRGKEFIDAQKKLELFTPLTYKIFWRENPFELLENYTESLDALDKYSHSALTIALANEDFILANALIEKGANVFLEDKLVLEIALTSIIQRDDAVIDKIMAGTPKDDANWIREYLDYLHGFVIGKPTGKPAKYRDVFNPPIRHFGQVLDTMVYFNGTPSHYGFVGPSLELLNAHLQTYTKELQDANAIELFKMIASTFDFTQKTCKFQGNLPTNNAAETLTTQILTNLDKNNKDIIFLPGGWAGSSVAIAFINNILIFTNLGIGGDPAQGTKIFAITNKTAITPKTMNTFLRGLGNATSPIEVLALIGEIVDAKPLFTLNQSLTPIDNCIFVNPRAIIQGMLLVLDANQKHGSATAENLPPLADKINELYKAYVNSLYKHSTADLAKFMRNQELLQNKRIECCSLALEYINQHYDNHEALKRCIELKNALEYVGLKDYYNANILPEAKAAIKKVMIREQEITAIKVIELEYAMLGKQQ
jgi:hypothetical protein